MRTLLLALLLAACGSSSSSTKPVATPAVSPASTGPLTEEQFKALHELPAEGPAQRRGETIDLAGTRAYLSVPAGEGPHPGIVVIHEFWGLNANIEHWADRLASAGWAALAVDLYGGVVATDRDAAVAAMKAVKEPAAAATIKAAIDFLSSDERVRATKQAVIGWCFGGGWSLRAAIANPDLEGAIIYYGQLETDPAKLAPIKARLLGIFGALDEGIPPAKVEEFQTALKTAGVHAEIHMYDAPHAFANPSNPKYDEKAAADAWSKVLAFLGEL